MLLCLLTQRHTHAHLSADAAHLAINLAFPDAKKRHFLRLLEATTPDVIAEHARGRGIYESR